MRSNTHRALLIVLATSVVFSSPRALPQSPFVDLRAHHDSAYNPWSDAGYSVAESLRSVSPKSEVLTERLTRLAHHLDSNASGRASEAEPRRREEALSRLVSLTQREETSQIGPELARKVEIHLQRRLQALQNQINTFAPEPAHRKAQSGISGILREAATGFPIRSEFVALYDSGGFLIELDPTQNDGSYLFGGLPAGTYFARTVTDNFFDELYDNIPCPLECDETAGTPITVVDGALTDGIDFELSEGGVLSGTVSEAATGFPIAIEFVALYDSSGSFLDLTFTEFDGSYRFSGLPTGNYFVATDAEDYFDEVYDNHPCPFDCDVTQGTPVFVTKDQQTRNIDFALREGASISGTLSEETTGFPLARQFVRLYDSGGSLLELDLTDTDGSYILGGLPAETYFVRTDTDNFFDELFDDIPCPIECDETTGTPINVTADTPTPNIDFALGSSSGITGRLTAQETGFPIVSEFVRLYDAGGSLIESEITENDGSYAFSGLPPGTYFVRTSTDAFFDELYDDIPCPIECDEKTGTPIPVMQNALTTDIDFQLEEGGVIEGSLREARTDLPIASERVVLYDSSGRFLDSARTLTRGRYRFAGLPTGTYFVKTDTEDFFDELYDNIPCPIECDETMGTAIVVTKGSLTDGIDFVLGTEDVPEETPCTDGPLLCLTGDRFHVTVDWRTADGEVGFGTAVTIPPALTADDSGLFFFFDASNWEMLVKVIDGCGFNNRFWVFAAATTNVEFTLQVNDVLTGESKRYVKALNTIAPAITDTDAFATCDALGPVPSRGPRPNPDAGHANPLPWPSVNGVEAGANQANCVPGPTTLCLNEGRFRAEINWRDFAGNTAAGQRVLFGSDNSGLFYFFNPDNWEMLIKVLDGCGFNDRFWIFFAATTNVEFSLKVTDTETGITKAYTNPLQKQADTILDTDAFATCP